jgi:hypothetical protein
MTERMLEEEKWGAMTPFRVPAERPVLSCCQESTICVRQECAGVFGVLKRMPITLKTILARFHTPMTDAIANNLNTATLISFFSPFQALQSTQHQAARLQIPEYGAADLGRLPETWHEIRL